MYSDYIKPNHTEIINLCLLCKGSSINDVSSNVGIYSVNIRQKRTEGVIKLEIWAFRDSP